MCLRTGPALASSGDAIARAPDGRVVFVEGAAPDELVDVEITSESKRYMRARVVSVVEPGPERVEPPCKVFGVCGGCTLQHVAPAAQVRSKLEAFLETLRRIGRVDLAAVQIDPPWSGQPYGYRTRARFAVAPGRVVGYRRRGGGSRDIVDAEACPILAPPLALALSVLRGRVTKDSGVVEEVEAVAAGGRALVHLPNLLARKNPGAGGEGPVEIVGGRSRRTLVVEDEHGPLLLSPSVFSQANEEGNRALVAYAGELAAAGAPHERIVELYAGSGNLTRKLAGLATAVEAYEGSEDASRLANRVLPEHARVRAQPVEQALEVIAPGCALLVANPPRAGISEDAARAIAGLAPERMIYVSCDPATFARDVGRLSTSGLVLRRVRLFDLYPQTSHAEVVGFLERG